MGGDWAVQAAMFRCALGLARTNGCLRVATYEARIKSPRRRLGRAITIVDKGGQQRRRCLRQSSCHEREILFQTERILYSHGAPVTVEKNRDVWILLLSLREDRMGGESALLYPKDTCEIGKLAGAV
jgi:hypothetical protein